MFIMKTYELWQDFLNSPAWKLPILATADGLRSDPNQVAALADAAQQAVGSPTCGI